MAVPKLDKKIVKKHVKKFKRTQSDWKICMKSSLTGESLPITKSLEDGVYLGSTCKQGEIEVVINATDGHTFYGKSGHHVDSTNQVGHFQNARAIIPFNYFRPR